ncbi:MAG TPA: hypothetical protein VL996_06530 [Methylocella sp.]|nr:hypothetical protein [Methylocella sp.]
MNLIDRMESLQFKALEPSGAAKIAPLFKTMLLIASRTGNENRDQLNVGVQAFQRLSGALPCKARRFKAYVKRFMPVH